MEHRKAKISGKYAKEDAISMVKRLLFGALVISTVGFAAYLSLLLMMYFI